MARRKADGGEDISLFPFLSVLACVIGTLTMIIAAVAVSALDNDTVDQALEYQEKKTQLDKENEELKELEKLFKKKQSELEKNQSEEQKRVKDLKDKLAELLAQLKETDKKLANISLDGNKIDVAVNNEDVEAMKSELKERREKIAQMEKEIADRNLPPEESEVSILPGGSGVGFNPSFVECDNGRVVIHEGAKTTPIRTAELNTSPKYAEILDEVKKDDKGSLIFLIRDDGLGTYYRARDLANAKQVKNGKLPVVGDGRIDLSYFGKAKK